MKMTGLYIGALLTGIAGVAIMFSESRDLEGLVLYAIAFIAVGIDVRLDKIEAQIEELK